MDPLGAMAMAAGGSAPPDHDAAGQQAAAAAPPAAAPASPRSPLAAASRPQQAQQPPQQQQRQQQEARQRPAQAQQLQAASAAAASRAAAAVSAAAAAVSAAVSAAAAKLPQAPQLNLPSVAIPRLGSGGSAPSSAPSSATAASAAAQQQEQQAGAEPRSSSASSLSQQSSQQQPTTQPQPRPPSPNTRAEQFRRVLEGQPSVDMSALRALAFEGIPDEGRSKGLRAAVYRLLLGLLPAERAQWERALQRKRAEYAQFCEELILDPKNLSHTPAGVGAAPGSAPNPLVSSTHHPSSPSSRASLGGGGAEGGSSTAASGHTSAASLGSAAGGGAPGAGSNGSVAAGAAAAAAGREGSREVGEEDGAQLARLALSADDHPLSTSSSSKWQAYFKDVEVQEQIERDVERTHPDMHFFSASGGGAAAAHRAQMRRALFVFAKLNPGLRYVQGMNELYAPLYYLFRTDPAPGASEAAEADAFFCFVDLMGEMRDHFCQQLDNSTVGIRATLARLSALLRQHDEELWEHLERGVRINPQFYAFRWITLALTQEFPFPDALRLWDTLLSDPAGRTDCLLRVCVAMLLHVRQELLQGDFASCMKLLQRYPPVDVHVILAKAEALKRSKTVIVLD